MELIDKAFALCEEIEQRQAQLRDILRQIADQSSVEKENVATETKAEAEITAETVAETISVPEIKPAVSHVNADLKKAFTINDRFRFRRELFGGDDKSFNDFLCRLSECESLSDAESCLSTIGNTDNDITVLAMNDLKEIIANFFNGYHR